jgi:hypothetical protein
MTLTAFADATYGYQVGVGIKVLELNWMSDTKKLRRYFSVEPGKRAKI